jgi:hypothetical protein
MTSQPVPTTDARRDRVPVKSGPLSRPKAGRVLTRIVVVTALLVAVAGMIVPLRGPEIV